MDTENRVCVAFIVAVGLMAGIIDGNWLLLIASPALAYFAVMRKPKP